MDTLKRRRAWAKRGQRTTRLLQSTDACRLSFLPAVSLDGILGIIAHPGAINRLDFEYFLEEVLVSQTLIFFITIRIGIEPDLILSQLASRDEPFPGSQ
jgi:hypothetical protein